jgi:hypothetical protein
MKLADRITKGEWVFDKHENFSQWFGNITGHPDPKDGQVIRTILCLTRYPEDPEQKANALLIAEAGTVANETGKTPRELLDQRDEAVEACKKAFIVMANPDICTKQYKKIVIEMAQQAIANAGCK